MTLVSITANRRGWRGRPGISEHLAPGQAIRVYVPDDLLPVLRRDPNIRLDESPRCYSPGLHRLPIGGIRKDSHAGD